MKQYVVTEEEFMSLIEGLKLEQFHSASDPNRFLDATGKPDVPRLHKAFHHRVIVWMQSMGFKGYRE
jgi:hypothetical protein